MTRKANFAILITGALALAATEVTAGHDRRLVKVRQFRAGASQVEFPAGESVPVFPQFTQDAPPASDRPRGEKLSIQSKLELIRYVQHEFVRAVKPIPGGKKGFRFRAGQPLDEQALRNATGSAVPAASPGDTVQITKLDFKGDEIHVDINGGGKKKKSWRERIQISGGGGIPTARTTSTTPTGPPGFQGVGSTLILEFEDDIPDLTVQELKQYLGVFVDFEGQRSAAVHWIDTLPPEVQEAIKEKRAIVGMDREMVVASMGKPEKKVREKDIDGLETEDWIYGHPPAKTVFVKFAGDKVISVKEFPN